MPYTARVKASLARYLLAAPNPDLRNPDLRTANRHLTPDALPARESRPRDGRRLARPRRVILGYRAFIYGTNDNALVYTYDGRTETLSIELAIVQGGKKNGRRWHGCCFRHRAMRSPTNTSVTCAFGTSGTDPNVRGIAVLIAGLVLGACGGETKNGGAKSSTDGGGTTAITTTTGSGATSQGATVTSGTTSSATVAGNTFGSGPSTSNGTNTGTSTGSGGAGGDSGVGGASGAGGGPATCEAQDVAGVGACDAAFGVFFLGSGCGWVSGCSCEGVDCDKAYPDEVSCELANRGCSNGCTPQDITLVGGCEPGPIYVFNGTECVTMVGCDCIGEDCGMSYRSSAECQSAHAVCVERERSCENIAAAYDDYVSHTACTEDSDCQIAYGLCGIGLGDCYHAVNRRWGEDGVRALGQEWLEAACGGPVCDCAPPSEAAVCDSGTCVPGP